MRILFERYPWFTAATALAFAVVWLHALTVTPWWIWVPVSWVLFQVAVVVLVVAGSIAAKESTTDAVQYGKGD